MLTITRGLGGLVAALLCLRLLLLVLRGRLDPVTGLGVGLGAVVLLGPVVHPWYLLWAAIPLAATRGMPRHRRAALAASALLAVMLPPTGADFAFRSFQLPLAILAGIVILLVALLLVRRELRQRRAAVASRSRSSSRYRSRPRSARPRRSPLDGPDRRPGRDGRPAHAPAARTGTARPEAAGPPSPTTGPTIARPRLRRVSPRPRRPDPGPRKRPWCRSAGWSSATAPSPRWTGWTSSSAPASVLALLGPNGAGKSTTVEVCTGFATADAGEVRVLGVDPAGAPDALRARIGVMPQGGGAYPGVRAGEMLRAGRRVRGAPARPGLADRRARACGGCARTPYKRLSGGQQQRLALACAIVGRPELVFLDEPTAGLDPQGRRLVWELVDALRRDGVAVLLTTHLMEEAEALADHVVIVDHGRVVAEGSPAALTTGGDQELRFRARPGMDVAGLATALPAGYRAAETLAGRYVVQGRIDPAVLSAITGWCAAQGALADDVQVARRSLEDVFLELTGRELRS